LAQHSSPGSNASWLPSHGDQPLRLRKHAERQPRFGYIVMIQAPRIGRPGKFQEIVGGLLVALSVYRFVS